jgi:myo-inositol 2-dehydrogenase/D-chiro-inositol 1-dehydrogenase
VKVGILGAGNISDTHARAALGIPGVEIAAVCGTSLDKAQRLAGKYGGTAYDDLHRFLDHRPLDIV